MKSQQQFHITKKSVQQKFLYVVVGIILACQNVKIHSTKLKMVYNQISELFFSASLKVLAIESSSCRAFNFKKLYGPFLWWGSTASRLEPLQGDSLLFTTKFPEIPGTHFIDLRRMKGWVDLGATQ